MYFRFYHFYFYFIINFKVLYYNIKNYDELEFFLYINRKNFIYLEY